MSVIKSFSVGDGDMFYINHESDNFTVIDCFISDLTEEKKKEIIEEIKELSGSKGITRFISTHPDDDHIGGLDYFDKNVSIYNFYCVNNEATKKDETEDFKKYCKLRDSTENAYHIYQGCSRKWMNESDETRGSSGISILWPKRDNEYFKNALEKAKNGESPNNISPIIKYSLEDGVKVMWMGDLEKDFMVNIKDDLNLPNIDILFAPHHGRDSGKIPAELLSVLDPKIIVIGEAPSEHLNYYKGYNTITQNTAGDIIFECDVKKVHIYVSNEKYKVTYLNNDNKSNFKHYLGTLNL